MRTCARRTSRVTRARTATTRARTTTATTRARARSRAVATRAVDARDAHAATPAPRGRRDALAQVAVTSAAAAVSAFSVLSAPRAARAYGTGGWKDCAPICDELKNGKADQERLMAEMMEMSRTGTVPPKSGGADASSSTKPAVDANGRLIRKQK